MTLQIREVLLATDFQTWRSRRVEPRRISPVDSKPAYTCCTWSGRAATPSPAPGALARAIERLGAGLRTVAAETAAGSPSREIASYAAHHGIDLVVVGTHGRTGVSRALLGSVAEAVVRRATCRVLTVPAEAPASRPGHAASGTGAVRGMRQVSDDLICAHCRALIRGESLQRKRAGRGARGSLAGADRRRAGDSRSDGLPWARHRAWADPAARGQRGATGMAVITPPGRQSP